MNQTAEIAEALRQVSEALDNVILGYGIGILIPLSYCCIAVFYTLKQKITLKDKGAKK